MMRTSRKIWQSLAAVLIVALSVSQGMTTVLAATTTITINGSGSGRTFDGVGAISGGGGTSRLLWDYPPQQQSEILDYLFKPNYGASLQILKVEIGGDTNSSEGAEPSHMRTAGSENYQRGYEWWLMEQARARNPNIKFAALEWGAPGWFSGGFWSQDNINYIIKWIQHAQSDHGLTISYIGGWNERGYNITWYENLRTALNNAGLSSVKIVADDGLGSSNWAVANDLSTNAAFKTAVSIAGTHYTNTSTSTAQGLGMPLWSSENGSVDYDTGGATVANKLNLDYINGKMTAYLHWNAVAAYYNTLPFYPWGTILADQPWSGFYKVGRNVWALAHTAQFAQPGWKYIDSASGTLAGGGSYVTLKSPNNSDYSIIFETSGASQTVNISVLGLSTGAVHVWSTNLASTNPSTYMVKGSDITPSGGSYSLTLQPGFAYSVTTTTGQGKGSTTPPASAVMGIPYADNFEGYGGNGKLAKYFSDLNGAFETAACTGGHTGTCYRQVINVAPISWTTSPGPTSVVGDPHWTNYQVSIDALLEQAGSIDLVGRMNLNTHAQTGMQGYHLRVSNSGAWSLLRQVAAGTNTTLASGAVSFPLNSWHNLALNMQGATIQAYYDNALLATVTDSTYSTGQATIQMGGWQLGQFDNFAVTASHTGSGPTLTPTRTPTPGGPTLTPTRTSTPGGVTNLALGKVSSADSVQAANPIANGNDGSTSTRWAAANGNTGHWWKVDLGTSHQLTGSEVMWEFARNYKYRVELSTDNTNWTTVVDKTNNTSTAQTQTDNFTANARYVRITVTGLQASPITWASFFEFRVFGS